MRAAVPICVVVLAGCRGLLGIDNPVVGDDAVDAPALSDAATCWGTVPFPVCATVSPTATVDLHGMTLDTDSDPMCTTYMGACLVAFASGTAGALTVTGTRPLILLATDTLLVDAPILAKATGGAPGPGGTIGPCDAATAPGGDANGGGGGAGGSFVTTGGGGGGGASGAIAGGVPGTAVAHVSTLRGGCPGIRGGAGGGGATGDTPGAAGGAIYILGGRALFISTAITVGGGGGGAGRASKSGGSGGGSGGMIALWSPQLTGTPTLIANGGGGGGGADNGAAGEAGTDAGQSLAAAPGGGGGGGGGPGAGGNGSSGTAGGTIGVQDVTGAGGGGGGGGGGVIVVTGDNQFTNPVASPPISASLP